MNVPDHPWTISLLKSNPDLFRLIHDFNHRPGHWLHPSRAAALPDAELTAVLLQRGHDLKRLNVILLEKLGLRELPPCWDFSEPRRRLALLRHDTLARLATFCGAALRWSRVATVIGRNQIAELKGAIGEHAHAFALRRGRLVVDPESAAQTTLPGRSLHEEIHELGWHTLLSSLSGESPALLSRLALKLPEDLPQPDYGSIGAETRDSSWQKLRKVLAEVLTREEMRCFA